MISSNDQPRVVISGLGFISSIGNDTASVTRSLRELRHGIATYEFFPGRDLEVKVAGTIKDFDTRSTHFSEWRWPECYAFERDVLRSLPPHGLHALCAVEQLIADAKLTPELLANGDTGLFTASAGSPFLQRHYLNQFYDSGCTRVHPMGIVSTIPGTLNFNLAPHYHIKGAVCGFVSACASTAHAIGYASDEIQLGRQQRILIVGAEDLTMESTYSFQGMRALSRNTDPDTASRPFDQARDGFVGTGGAASVLIESAASAQARGAPIYAELLGWGQASDGHNMAIAEPEGRGLVEAMRRALTDARITPGEVGYINAHATSTPIGDRSEIRAINTVFSSVGAKPAISSTKALTGHPLSMASVLETGFCALALAQDFTPGQAHLVTPDPEAVGLNLPQTTQPVAPGIILKNSSGFGGSNVSLVLRRWPDSE
jgi:3-oxoacyl-[acyl-carrier-protein] synthase I